MMNAAPASPDFSTPYQGGFVGGEHRFALRVYYEDTDVAGIVYYANYLKYMERARSDMLRAAGIDQRAGIEGGAGAYAVASLDIRYLRPARLEDALLVASRVDRVTAASVHIHQQVRRGEQRLTDARVVAAWLSLDGRPQRQPRPWREAFEALGAA